MKRIVVVGGGTAGWLTALFIKQKLKNVDLTLIESSEIGILGAGEGTTPHLVSVLEQLGIDISQILKEAKGTIKNGILFTNWNGDDKKYFHPFYDAGQSLSNFYKVGQRISEGDNLDSLVPSSFLSNQKKAKIIFNPEKNQFHAAPPSGIALHFDARLLAKFLKKIGLERGITLIDAKVEKLVTNGEDISSIVLDSGDEIISDFIFDCTGLKRLIIGQHYKSEWVSYKESIPNNRAIPFFLPEDKEIPPYTEAIAMDYGWVWKIPVQGRFGCGYVFDSRLVSDDQAKEEIVRKFGNTDFPTTFNFEPGCYKEIWKGNCIAVGLSSGFIEPLEATSIWNSIEILKMFLNCSPGMYGSNNAQAYRDSLNKWVFNLNEEILAFIYFHYCCRKMDTVYWTEFRKNNKAPRLFKNIEEVKNNLLGVYNDSVLPFTFNKDSILAVGAGNNYFSEEAGKDLILHTKTLGTFEGFRNSYVTGINILSNYVKACVDHTHYINVFKDKNEQ